MIKSLKISQMCAFTVEIRMLDQEGQCANEKHLFIFDKPIYESTQLLIFRQGLLEFKDAFLQCKFTKFFPAIGRVS